MLKLLIKTLIFVLIYSYYPYLFADVNSLILFLIAITASSLNQYYNIKKLTFTTTVLYSTLALFNPIILNFLPLLIFDVAPFVAIKYALAIPIILLVINVIHSQKFFFLIVLTIISIILALMFEKIKDLDFVNKEIRDTNSQQKNILTLKNQQLLESQNELMHMIKLQERNRIARDIHDTIGHSLSRALLQTGAVSAVNQNEELQTLIDALKNTLTDSMNQIRNSIHDLKDDSIDLKQALSQILDESGFKTTFTYDIESDVANDVKNCFLVGLKESVTNTRKHSNASSIILTVAEHPAMYQFLVTDNGTIAPTNLNNGIGLQNINERISELGGYCRMNYQNGFRTFITIPKKMEEN